MGEKVLALAKRLKKKDAPSNSYKTTTDNILIFKMFVVKKIFKSSNITYN